MTKIEEILCKHFELIYLNGTKCEPELEFLEEMVSTGLDYKTLIESMKEYAEFYAKSHCELLFEKMVHWSKSSIEELSKLILETELLEHE